MTNNQRGLVDDIIEEGQYEAAIEMLFQLRSPQYKPSVYVGFFMDSGSELTYPTALTSGSLSFLLSIL